jgi:S-formylglutathione hydrolase FrmB
MKKLLFAFIFFVYFFSNCNSNHTNLANYKEQKKDTILSNINVEAVLRDTIIEIPHSTGPVIVYIEVHTSTKLKGTLVLLPGWNFPAKDWCLKTDFCKRAKAAGYQLIMPEMKKSMYANHAFKETRKDLKNVLSRIWFNDTLVKYLQDSMQVLLPSQMNGVCGISSGARGAALVAMDKPEIFKVAVALSGDFNPYLLESDKLMNIFYGKFNQFKQRWIDNDNVYNAASSFQVPILLLHGAKDNVVSVKQSISFHKELKRVNPTLKNVLIVDSLAGHTYSYWGNQTDNILSFIEQIFMKQKKN